MARKSKRGPKPKRKGRSASSLKRVPGNIAPRAHILIVCEGAKTEPTYFAAFRNKLRLTSVDIERKSDSDPLKVIEYAVQCRNKRAREAKRSDSLANYGEVWCVIDVENLAQNTSFDPAVRKAKREEITLAVSNPAFEYWYLLHYVETSKPFSGGQAVKRELKEHISDYSESKNVFPELYKMTELAVKRAKQILSNHPDNSPFPNPSTFVFRLHRTAPSSCNILVMGLLQSFLYLTPEDQSGFSIGYGLFTNPVTRQHLTHQPIFDNPPPQVYNYA